MEMASQEEEKPGASTDAGSVWVRVGVHVHRGTAVTIPASVPRPRGARWRLPQSGEAEGGPLLFLSRFFGSKSPGAENGACVSRALAARHPAAFPESLLNKFLLIARGKEQVVVGWKKKKKKGGKGWGNSPLLSHSEQHVLAAGCPGVTQCLAARWHSAVGKGPLCVCSL